MSNITEGLRVARLLHDSVTDGPGLRYVVFTQGCPHRCEGCHNPETHDPAGGSLTTAEDILEDLGRNPLNRAVTFSGGEPFLQTEALIPLAERLRDLGYPLWIFTGYLWEDLIENQTARSLCALAEVVKDGSFLQGEQSYSLLWRGSRNQRLIDTQKSLASGETVLWTARNEADAFPPVLR